MKSKINKFQNKTTMSKKIYITLLTSFLLLSCGGEPKNSTTSVIESGTLDQLRAKRSELVQQANDLSKELALIDDAIGKKDADHKLALITVFAAKDTVFNHYLELQANVQTKENIVLNSEMGGILQQVYVTEGQSVTKGQTLGKIDDGGLSSQLAQMETQAALAKTTFERQKNYNEMRVLLLPGEPVPIFREAK